MADLDGIFNPVLFKFVAINEPFYLLNLPSATEFTCVPSFFTIFIVSG